MLTTEGSPRIAKSLHQLYEQVNELAPQRNRTNGPDGDLGDTAHAARTSDHNPNSEGVVCALDITHDPAGGFDSYSFAESLRQFQDERIKYVISNKKIFYGPRSPSHGDHPESQWKWNPYNGSNPHDKHIHISVGDKRYYDDISPWRIGDITPPIVVSKPILQRGSTGEDVKQVQQMLLVDGIYGRVTEQAVKGFQRSAGLAQDGIVGPSTWSALVKPPAPSTDDGWHIGITATVFGGNTEVQRSAYDGHVIGETELAVSLPAHIPSPRPEIEVQKTGTTEIHTATDEDIGPWYEDDPYWTEGRRPLAEKPGPILRGPNKGRTSNGAGIDLSPGLAKALGIDGKGQVNWRFKPKEKVTPEIEIVTTKPSITGVLPMTQEQVLSAVRWILSTVGPLLVTHGYIGDSTWQMIAGIVTSLAPLIWSIVSKTPTGLINTASKLPQVAKIVATPEIAEVNLANNTKVVSR